jgi:hypothetical protein
VNLLPQFGQGGVGRPGYQGEHLPLLRCAQFGSRPTPVGQRGYRSSLTPLSQQLVDIALCDCKDFGNLSNGSGLLVYGGNNALS